MHGADGYQKTCGAAGNKVRYGAELPENQSAESAAPCGGQAGRFAALNQRFAVPGEIIYGIPYLTTMVRMVCLAADYG